MQVTAKLSGARISAQKVRLVADQIRGMPVEQAEQLLAFSTKKAAHIMKKVLLSAIAITLYFIIGSRWEERKLIAYHGEIYRRYRQQVPGLIPLPWRYLNRIEAEALQQHDQHF